MEENKAEDFFYYREAEARQHHTQLWRTGVPYINSL